MSSVHRTLTPPGRSAIDLRRDLLADLAADVRLGGRVPAGFFILGDGFVDRVDVAALRAEHPHADLAATWAALRAVPELRATLLLLVVATEGDGRTAILLDRPRPGDPHADDVRVAELAWNREPVSGCGRVTRGWTETTFTPADQAHLSPAIRALLQAPPGAAHAPLGRIQVGDLAVRRWHDPEPSARVRDATAADLATRAVRTFAADLARGERKGACVVTTRGDDWDLWELRGRLPCPEDDVLRQVALHEPDTQGIARAKIITAPQSEPPVPGVLVEAELRGAGGEIDRAALFLPFTFAPEGSPRAGRGAFLRHPGEARWLGVPPRFHVGFGEMEEG
jgi:hypothetical protein